MGHVSELFTGSKPPRYLQVGSAYLASCSDLGQGWVRSFGKLRDVKVGRGAVESGSAGYLIIKNARPG